MPRAEVRRPSADDRPLNRSSASSAARTFFALIDEKDAAPLDGLAQHAAEIAEQDLHLAVAELIGAAARMNAGAEERLVGVQIADAGDDVLRQQQRLDRAA